jgi:hypothetical protein
MAGIVFQNKLSDYEGFFMEYLILLDAVGDLSGGTVRVLDGYNVTTDNQLSTIDATSGTSTDTTTTTDGNACWETCVNNSDCIVSNFNIPNSMCTLYGNPTADGSLTYVTDENYTSTIYNNDYYYYMILNLNTKLQSYNGELQQELTADNITEEELVGASILDSELKRQSEKLDADRALLLASMQQTNYNKEYNDTYLVVDSKNSLYTLWMCIAVFSAIVAFLLCYSILKDKQIS